MAVSGRKLPDFQSSVQKGSAENFNHECDTCLSDGQHKDAHGYCTDCKEYLCKNCFKFHQITKALKHHRLLDKTNIGEYKTSSTTTQVCTEKCTRHAKEVIKFFCLKHKVLGCHNCMIMDHRTCKIDYILDNCAGIDDSEEYKGTMWLLNQKLKEIDSVIKKATVRDKEIDVCYDKLIQEIIKFRKEINDRLDQLQKQIEKEADRKKSDDKQVIKKALQTCTNVSADMNKLQTNSSSSNQSKLNGQLYLNMKQAQSKLKSDEIQKAEETLEKTNMQYTFQRNKNLVDILSKPNILGSLNLSNNLVLPQKEVDKLVRKEDINVRTKSDTNPCFITGCAVLSSNKLVLADTYNHKVKVVDIPSKVVTEEKELDFRPWDIATMSSDQIAVTIPNNSEVIIIKAA
ncbi:E3 ubiquitin-protein ligase TRIM33-like, partial [Mercenaria mercenaria]|uniref:E3 ubiquitin-protein ligase TRIM33-like n=1 Tax=Mercenaria mercenaria TaxID=6596 RepID=UPI00234FB56A